MAMRLIDADELLSIVRSMTVVDKSVMHRILIQMPPVDAVPVRHGRWVMMEGELAFWDECSECGKKILHRTPYYDFCPNCGADMRGEKDETD